MNESRRVLLVDHHPAMRAGLASVIKGDGTLDVCGATGRAREALDLCRTLQPDVALVDVQVAIGRTSVIQTMQRACPQARIIATSTWLRDSDVWAAVMAGARAYVVKSIEPAALLDVVHAVLSGERFFSAEIAACLADTAMQPRLSARELDVVGLISGGANNRAIATRLGVSLSTVKAHVTRVLTKLGASNRIEAATVAFERGLVRARWETGLPSDVPNQRAKNASWMP
jgi:two-component system NarL family response regulator